MRSSCRATLVLVPVLPAVLAACTAVLPSTLAAQAVPQAMAAPDPADVASPEAIVTALYASIARAPGQDFDWERFLSLFVPDAPLVPNTEQTGGQFLVHTPRSFMRMVDSLTVVGGPDDQGFQEEQIASRTERFGDVAHVFSTYQKHVWESEEILGRGVNSIQLVWNDGRWWITAIAWDEEVGAGPLPERYLSGGH